jgi:hypothetical protein
VVECELLQPLERHRVVMPGAVGHSLAGVGQMLVNIEQRQGRQAAAVDDRTGGAVGNNSPDPPCPPLRHVTMGERIIAFESDGRAAPPPLPPLAKGGSSQVGRHPGADCAPPCQGGADSGHPCEECGRGTFFVN